MVLSIEHVLLCNDHLVDLASSDIFCLLDLLVVFLSFRVFLDLGCDALVGEDDL